MKHFLLVYLILFSNCKMRFVNECNTIEAVVNLNDEINPIEDKEFGIGVDGLFTSEEFKVYHILNGFLQDEILQLNDYNLQSAFSNKKFNNSKYDSLAFIINFSALKGIRADTAIGINKIYFYNGDRSSLKNWDSSNSVKEIEVRTSQKCLGTAILKNTYKFQSIVLGETRFIKSGSLDTLFFVIKSTYNLNENKHGYSISEVGFDGIKMY